MVQPPMDVSMISAMGVVVTGVVIDIVATIEVLVRMILVNVHRLVLPISIMLVR